MIDVTPVEPEAADLSATAPAADPPPVVRPATVEALPPDTVVSPESDIAEPDDPATPGLPAVVVRQGDATTLPTTNSGVRINRIGDDDPVAEAEDAPDTIPAEGLDLLPEPDSPALVRYAAAFANPDAKPILSIILIDEGGMGNAAIALGSLPFPVTVAIDPGTADATARMDSYRAAGIEVLALARLPQGARPADVEVTFESVFATLPEAVGVLDAGEGGLQADSSVTDQAMGRFAADGRGVVTLDEGLNMALRAATAAGVPAATIYRDLDGEGQDIAVIRRFLDQAAFRARQTSGVILLGRVRADTLSALTLWGDQSRAEQVAVAPVSAVLLP